MKIDIIQKKDFSVIAFLIEEVQNLHAALFPSVYKPFQYHAIKDAMEKMFADEQSRVFVAQSNGETIGYLLVLIKEIPENAFHYSYKYLHIDQVVVSKKHQKAGVGSMLMDKAELLAKELSILRVELDHLHINTEASTFFERKAYIPYREKRFKILDQLNT